MTQTLGDELRERDRRDDEQWEAGRPARELKRAQAIHDRRQATIAKFRSDIAAILTKVKPDRVRKDDYWLIENGSVGRRYGDERPLDDKGLSTVKSEVQKKFGFSCVQITEYYDQGGDVGYFYYLLIYYHSEGYNKAHALLKERSLRAETRTFMRDRAFGRR